MTKYSTTQKDPKTKLSDSGFDSSLSLWCFVIPPVLGLSDFGSRFAFIAPGGGELLLILLVLILLFGTKDAPRILRNIQTVLNKMQRSAADFRYKLMYSDLHSPASEDSADTLISDNSGSDDDSDHALNAEDPPSDPEAKKHEKSV